MSVEGDGVMDRSADLVKIVSDYLEENDLGDDLLIRLGTSGVLTADPLLARIAELEAKLAESERLAGVLREQRNKAEDELRLLGRVNPWSA